jgi:mannose-6-phosphate isomerase
VAAWAQPLLFQPILVPRVWGGERLRERFGKPVPEGAAIGESWEVVDRTDAQSVLDERYTLNELWRDHRREIFGARGTSIASERFPLLVKFLDAQQPLSVQVHPPAERCVELRAEPKSEAWLFLETDEATHVYAGLNARVIREDFEHALRHGNDVTTLLRRIDVSPGTGMYLPSGRVHAMGAGCLVAEVQQSSDSTYRVWDYGRPDLDGRPRALHIDEALVCIDFADTHAALIDRDAMREFKTPFFEMGRLDIGRAESVPAARSGEAAIVGVLRGDVSAGARSFSRGQFFLCPAEAGLMLRGQRGAEVLRVLLPA